MPTAMFSPDEVVRTRMFEDRRTAGAALGRALLHLAGREAVVLGLPRGGVPVADEVARTLGGSLDVWVVRKLGAPMRPELGMGAIAEGSSVVIDRAIVRHLGVGTAELIAVARREMEELRRRVVRLRGDRPLPDLRGRIVILVDDGIATGSTMRAAIRGVRRQRPAHLVVATPVASPDIAAQLRTEADEVVCLHEPRNLHAIGLWYEDFRHVPDEQVVRILESAAVRPEP